MNKNCKFETVHGTFEGSHSYCNDLVVILKKYSLHEALRIGALLLNSNILPELKPRQLEKRELQMEAYQAPAKNQRCHVELLENRVFLCILQAPLPQTRR